ncbi:hypothetical protein QIS74_04705 [Colletotrichum tabaci]|uniref:Uncharacterized protein n=1 Tax=Colletotrichum tabaci TaxID=1209068 RepID=A0AAV9TIV3_9PEZI
MEPFKFPNSGSAENTVLSRPASTADDSLKTERHGKGHSDVLPEQSQEFPSTCNQSIEAELYALKAKIQELEDRSKSIPSSSTKASEHQDQNDGKEQYRRMEKCLYNHRKEWESKYGNHDPTMTWSIVNDIPSWGPWKFKWDLASTEPYHRPNPFDPTHECQKKEHPNVGDADKDEFDYIIDFGDRRNRLRKAFEWEMDRLYLGEEIDRRRRQKVEPQADTREQTQDCKGIPGDTDAGQSVCMTVDVAWDEFQRLGQLQKSNGCYIHILNGEPMVREYRSFDGTWVGLPEQKTGHQSLAVSKKSQLPERIRIYSDVVFTILDKILGLTGLDIEFANDAFPVVFTRPFKALVYYDQTQPLDPDFSLKQCGDEETKKDAFETALSEVQSAAAKRQVPHDTQAPNREVSHDTMLGSSTTMSRDQAKRDVNAGNQAYQEKHEQENNNDDSDFEPGALEAVLQSPSAPEELVFFLNTLRLQVLHRREYLNGDQCSKVFFSDLWHLFSPGTEIIRRDGKQAYRVVHVTSTKHRMVSAFEKWRGRLNFNIGDDDETKKAPRPDFRITSVYIDFDGKVFGSVENTFDVKSFEGQREITSFEVFPLRLFPARGESFDDVEWDSLSTHQSATDFRQKLINRGSQFLEAIAKKHMYYAGTTLDTHEAVEGQVVVDFEAAFPVDEDPDLSSERPLIRALLNLNLEDYAIDLRQGLEYINSLLPKAGGQDLASVLILPQTLEELQTNAKPGKLLLPDNDLLILSYRVFGFLLRNRRFVFLRVLEYYTGILFLTTNRVGDFDEAFTSRIHMSLYYPDLNQDKTLKIFEINLKLIAERFALKERKIVIDQLGIGAFASQHFIDKPDARWNGRQIRNACQTALALAEFEAQGNSHRKILKPDAVVQLTVDHFKTVRNAYLEFTDYMKLVYGTTAARKAEEGKVRAILVDENNNFVGSVGGAGHLDRKAAYAQQSKTPLYASEHQPQENAQFQQHQAYHTGGYHQTGHYQTPPHGYHQSQVYPRPESFLVNLVEVSVLASMLRSSNPILNGPAEVSKMRMICQVDHARDYQAF